VLALGKRTIREVISRVIYDPSFDGADIDVYFLHSGNIWVVPFNFLEFGEGGFYFKGSFYPLYKILAIWDNFSKSFLLKRRDISGAKRTFELDFYDFPINLSALYSDLLLMRHLPLIIDFLDKKYRETLDDSWLESFSTVETVSNESISLKVITNGVLKGLAAVFIDDVFFKIIPLYPAFVKKDDIQKLKGSQKIVLGNADKESLVTCVFGKNFFCLSKDLHFIPINEIGLERRIQVQLLNRILYMDLSSKCVIGIRDFSSMLCVTPRFERLLLPKLGLKSCFNLDNMYKKNNIEWLQESGQIRISDWDQLYFE